MRNKFSYFDLILIVLITLIVIAFYYLETRYDVISLLCDLFIVCYFLCVPGYLLQAVIFHGSRELEFYEKITLSFGLSIASILFLGMGLDYLGISFNNRSVGISMGAYEGLLLILMFGFRIKDFRNGNSITSDMVKSKLRISGYYYFLGCILFISILVGVVSYSFPVRETYFTEFYIIDNISNINVDLDSYHGEQISLRFGVRNQEDKPSIYGIVAEVENTIVGALSPFTIKQDEIWEGELLINLNGYQGTQAIDIHLASEGEPYPYRSLRIYVNINNHE